MLVRSTGEFREAGGSRALFLGETGTTAGLGNILTSTRPLCPLSVVSPGPPSCWTGTGPRASATLWQGAPNSSSDLDGSGEEFPTPLHWRRKRLGVLVVSVGFVVGLTVQNLQSMLGTVESPGAPAPVLQDIGEIDGGFNVLMAGLDTREGQGEGFEFVNTEVNDVNLLVHISENREHALVVIFPRDLLLDVPACSQPDGAESNPREIAAAKRR